ncbi:hypothetical protein AVEN_131801-1 [Araneus ventricosus]|uniref:Uncharacterized protein n=1 Tax=Araneus ventricosus TaxID=182803 RepID=A0A4Y2KMW5_ARAVE|nr:hypothetical protein AVEN_131801-1 [Araneus ventricosus]
MNDSDRYDSASAESLLPITWPRSDPSRRRHALSLAVDSKAHRYSTLRGSEFLFTYTAETHIRVLAVNRKGLVYLVERVSSAAIIMEL